MPKSASDVSDGEENCVGNKLGMFDVFSNAFVVLRLKSFVIQILLQVITLNQGKMVLCDNQADVFYDKVHSHSAPK